MWNIKYQSLNFKIKVGNIVTPVKKRSGIKTSKSGTETDVVGDPMGMEGVHFQRWGGGSRMPDPDLHTLGWFSTVSNPSVEGTFLQTLLFSLPSSFLYEWGWGEVAALNINIPPKKLWSLYSFKGSQTIQNCVKETATLPSFSNLNVYFWSCFPGSSEGLTVCEDISF